MSIDVEAPYREGLRPRAEGRIQASMDDEELSRWNLGGNGDPAYASSRRGYHPAARVVIDTTVLDGFVPERSRRALSRQRVLSRTRDKGYWAMRVCYETLVRLSEPKSAEVTTRVDIGPSGKVSRTVLHDADTAAPEHEPRFIDCVRAALASIEYTPAPGRRVRVNVRIRLWPGDAPLPSVPAEALIAEPRSEPPPSRGDAAEAAEQARERRAVQEALRREVARLEPDVAECFTHGRDRDERLWGRLAARLAFDETGAVTNVSQHESHFPDTAVVECALESLRSVKIDAPLRGDAVKPAWIVPVRLPPEQNAPPASP